MNDNSRTRLLENLYDAVKKYMQHKNNTQGEGIKADSRKMDIRMVYRQDVLNALEALEVRSVQ